MLVPDDQFPEKAAVAIDAASLRDSIRRYADEALQTIERRHRWSAKLAIAHLHVLVYGDSRREVLRSRLYSDDVQTMAACARSLAGLADMPSKERLLEVLRDERLGAYLAYGCAHHRELWWSNPGRCSECGAKLVESRRLRAGRERLEVARALHVLGAEEGTSALVELVHSFDCPLALVALGEGSQGKSERVRTTLGEYSADDRPRYRVHAIVGQLLIGELQNARELQTLGPEKEGLGDFTVSALSRVQDPVVQELLIEIARDAGLSWDVRIAAGEGLVRSGRGEFREFLNDAYAALKGTALEWRAILALGQLSGKATQETLLGELRENRINRVFAAVALMEIEGRK